jgi:glycosyltransferase involved in cell wall biosynthesis
MRILLISGSNPPMRCGVGDYSARLAQALAKAGDDVHVLTSGAAAGENGVAYTTHACVQRWSPQAAAPLLRLVRTLRPDIAHVQLPTQGYGRNRFPWAIPLLLNVRRQVVVQTWHEFLPFPTHSLSMLLALSRGEIIVVRPGYVDQLPPLYRRLIASRPVTYVRGGSAIPTSSLREAERRALRDRIAAGAQRLVAFFGFANPNKNVEYLFDALDPKHDHLLLICGLDRGNAYHDVLLNRASTPPWQGRVTITGHVEDTQVADLLACVDAAVLPFRDGGGDWNSSLQAVRVQGTLAISTSRTRTGYDQTDHTVYCAPGAISEMRQALEERSGQRVAARDCVSAWRQIAEAHQIVYRRAAENADRKAVTP